MVSLKFTDVREVPGDSAFLIDDGETAVLYDTGFAFTGYAVSDRIAEELDGRGLDYILLTHSHYDHALGAPYILKRYPDAKVVAGSYAARIFSKESARATMRRLDRACAETYGITDYEDLIDELHVDIQVDDGDEIECGSMRFRVIGLPGHTRCSVGFYMEDHGILLGTETLGVHFGGDRYLPSCLVGYGMTLDSMAKVKGMDITGMVLPHYGYVDGEAANRYLDRSESVLREIAGNVVRILTSGGTREDAIAYFTDGFYDDAVREVYPVDAFELNTGIMIDLMSRELCQGD
ncbi:MAG: MBL fold metallo-hydrolase [Candidatus Methanomethylophilaceae archaeon]|nr:MBL fold metallo-hydrolase [Candidatus Methanomethylophilaceae archaeon]